MRIYQAKHSDWTFCLGDYHCGMGRSINNPYSYAKRKGAELTQTRILRLLFCRFCAFVLSNITELEALPYRDFPPPAGSGNDVDTALFDGDGRVEAAVKTCSAHRKHCDFSDRFRQVDGLVSGVHA